MASGTTFHRRHDHVKVGQNWTNGETKQIRVMAIAEGYVMARRKGCMPFLLTTNELVTNYTQVG